MKRMRWDLGKVVGNFLALHSLISLCLVDRSGTCDTKQSRDIHACTFYFYFCF